MLLKIFGYPTADGTRQSELMTMTNQIISYQYTKRFFAVGEFTLNLIVDKDTTRIVENCVLNIDNDWLFVDSVQRTDSQITVSGTDLDGWLNLRITAFGTTQVAGADGYDVVSGTTGDCVNHYINNNMINPEDSNRRLPRLHITQTAQGKAKDNYMARLQTLSEVVGSLCKGGTIGYEIIADSADGFAFRTLAGTDHSVGQNENEAVIFSQARHNLFSAEYERGNEDLLNAIYATGADVTQAVYRDGTIPTGVLRRETALDVSVESVEDIKDYALKQVEGNIANNSYNLDIRGVEDYGTVYRLGDYVTVKDANTTNYWTAQIVEVTKSVSANENKLSLVLGDAKEKLLNKIQNSVNIQSLSNGNRSANSVEQAVKNATKLITGNVGGYVVMHLDENEKPYEILVMDTEDIETATKVWRWNKSGFGYSGNGYNGSYGTAITMDGQIVADYITAGTLQGIEVIGTSGTIAGWKMVGNKLVSKDGTFEIDSEVDEITISDTVGKLMTLSQRGIKFWRADNAGGEEIGSIGVAKGKDNNTYGLTFNLVNGDAMTWSIKDENGVYINRVRYTDTDGFVISDKLTCGDFKGNITDVTSDGYSTFTGDLTVISSITGNSDGGISWVTTTHHVKNGLLID